MEKGQNVLFVCPDRCDTWQNGRVLLVSGNLIIVEPIDEEGYTYDSRKVYRFRACDIGDTVKEWEYPEQLRLLHRQNV